MSKQQTAVEWLFEELNIIRIEDEIGNIGTLSFFNQQFEALKKAKAMEEEQIKEAYNAAVLDIITKKLDKTFGE